MDIVTSLRERDKIANWPCLRQAAGEIERLRGEVEELKREITGMQSQIVECGMMENLGRLPE